MKRILKIGIIAAVAVIMFVGCVSSVNNDTTPTASPSPLNTSVVKTESSTTSMADISDAYMSKINITEECPASATEKRDEVTYGTVVHETYHSKTTGLIRGVSILLPPNYDKIEKYPVLYLLHGILGDEYTFVNAKNTKVANLIGNLISEGTAKEMIIVFPNMFATSDKDQIADYSAESIAAYDNFINDLINDLMPFIEENYSILTGRENQAIAGHSMGGREALYIGFTRPDLFGYTLGIAPAPGLTAGKDWAANHPGQMQEHELKIKNSEETPYLIMICCGSEDGTVGTFPESYHNILVNNEVTHIWYEVPGADHGYVAIHSGLYNFFNSVFQTEE